MLSDQEFRVATRLEIKTHTHTHTHIYIYRMQGGYGRVCFEPKLDPICNQNPSRTNPPHYGPSSKLDPTELGGGGYPQIRLHLSPLVTTFYHSFFLSCHTLTSTYTQLHPLCFSWRVTILPPIFIGSWVSWRLAMHLCTTFLQQSY